MRQVVGCCGQGMGTVVAEDCGRGSFRHLILGQSQDLRRRTEIRTGRWRLLVACLSNAKLIESEFPSHCSMFLTKSSSIFAVKVIEKSNSITVAIRRCC